MTPNLKLVLAELTWYCIVFMNRTWRRACWCLGCVKDVADFEVTVSLPCGLQGFLNIRNVQRLVHQAAQWAAGFSWHRGRPVGSRLHSTVWRRYHVDDITHTPGCVFLKYIHNVWLLCLQDIFSLPHLFSPGMVIRCVVAKLDVAKGGSLSIQLSVNPKLVNKALTSSSVKAGMVSHASVQQVNLDFEPSMCWNVVSLFRIRSWVDVWRVWRIMAA